MPDLSQIKVIAFDADDTLWINEPYFQETEQRFCKLLCDFLPAHSVSQLLFETEMKNLALYGYGAKGFMLSMIETALNITGHHPANEVLTQTLAYGHELLNKPVVLLDGVQEVLKALQGKYLLVVATKGDLLDQERKLKLSQIEQYFHHIEIMSDKHSAGYQKLIKHLDCKPGEFLMIGNSIKSDVLPVLQTGAFAAHIPYHTTWIHESGEAVPEHDNFISLTSLSHILTFLA